LKEKNLRIKIVLSDNMCDMDEEMQKEINKNNRRRGR
jgi:sensor histidine kinase YesM